MEDGSPSRERSGGQEMSICLYIEFGVLDETCFWWVAVRGFKWGWGGGGGCCHGVQVRNVLVVGLNEKFVVVVVVVIVRCCWFFYVNLVLSVI